MENIKWKMGFSELHFPFYILIFNFFQNAATVSADCMGVIGTEASAG